MAESDEEYIERLKEIARESRKEDFYHHGTGGDAWLNVAKFNSLGITPEEYALGEAALSEEQEQKKK